MSKEVYVLLTYADYGEDAHVQAVFETFDDAMFNRPSEDAERSHYAIYKAQITHVGQKHKPGPVEEITSTIDELSSHDDI